MDLSKQDQHGSIETRLTWIYQNKINMDVSKQDQHRYIETR